MKILAQKKKKPNPKKNKNKQTNKQTNTNVYTNVLAASIAAAKRWKQTKCPWTDEWINKMIPLIRSIDNRHTVHGVLAARILQWFAIPFSSGLCFVRTLHYDLSVLGGPARHGS